MKKLLYIGMFVGGAIVVGAANFFLVRFLNPAPVDSSQQSAQILDALENVQATQQQADNLLTHTISVFAPSDTPDIIDFVREADFTTEKVQLMRVPDTNEWTAEAQLPVGEDVLYHYEVTLDDITVHEQAWSDEYYADQRYFKPTDQAPFRIEDTIYRWVPEQAEPVGIQKVIGSVLDRVTKEPIAGILVELEGSYVITNTEGKFQFVDVPEGIHRLSAAIQSDMYEPSGKLVDVNPDTKPVVVFQLNQSHENQN